MNIIRESSEDEMVLAFLKAEVDSPEYHIYIKPILEGLGYTRTLIDNANLQNTYENQARVICLSYRGFKKNEGLFKRFPDKVSWHKMSLSVGELGCVKYINQPSWITRSGGTRLVIDGVRNPEGITIAKKTEFQIRAIEEKLKSGCIFPELILVGESERSDLILVEGHKRATAYVRARDYLNREIEVITGYSEDLNNWVWY